jgi:hypothetical protein
MAPKDPDALAFGEMLRRYRANARHGISLDASMRLTPPAGGDAWWTLAERKRRDDAIVAIFSSFFSDHSITGAAKRIAALTLVTAKDRDADRQLRGLLELIAANGGMPKARQVQNILQAMKPREMLLGFSLLDSAVHVVTAEPETSR